LNVRSPFFDVFKSINRHFVSPTFPFQSVVLYVQELPLLAGNKSPSADNAGAEKVEMQNKEVESAAICKQEN